MVHRGPDDHGAYLAPDHSVGLGFRRLSIIDLSGGHQPMSNEDGSVWIVFNGEIYNHWALRKELEKKGHRYSTLSDTETIIHLYEEFGSECVHKLRGMFAFAIWDEGRRRLFVARDRIGIKPLYFSQKAGRFVFASEIKALLELPWMNRKVNYHALPGYLSFASVPAPETMFKGISKLAPGHRLLISKDGKVQEERYWSPIPHKMPRLRLNEKKWIASVRDAFEESIRLRMMSDVPFGVFLSGGLDSSLNVALMSRMMDRPVDTFSVSIKGDGDSDELDYARFAAAHFRANYHQVVIDENDFLRFLPQMAYFQDEPIADPVCVPLCYVSELARQNGTIVVQVGEGADELFGGYGHYLRYLNTYWMWKSVAKAPKIIRTGLMGVGRHLLNPTRSEMMRRAVEGEPFFWGTVTAFKELEMAGMLGNRHDKKAVLSIIKGFYRDYYEHGNGSGLLNEIAYVELRHRLPELLLMRVDKMTMAASVEARVPFLDHELVRLALSIPDNLKCHNGQTKYLLKAVARGLLPDEIIDRPKRGFCGSPSNMVTAGLIAAMRRLLENNRDLNDLLDWSIFNHLALTYGTNAGSTGIQIWVLLNLALWYSVWIQEIDLEQIAWWLGVKAPMDLGGLKNMNIVRRV